MAKFPGGFQPFGKSFGQGGALSPGNACAMEPGDGVPAEVALRVEGPIGGNVNHRPIGCEVHRELEGERFIVLHAVEVPGPGERIDRRAKDIFATTTPDGKARAQIARGATAWA